MVSGCVSPQDDKWLQMFNGKDLNGWIVKGGAMKFYFDKNELVGEVVPGEPNGFLCSEKNYRNFILEYEFLPNAKLNSGVQIRGQSKTEYLNGRVHGMQVEIDPSSRSWTGGIYDEARRGWLYPLNENEPARLAYKSSDWNHIRVEAIGDTIKTWLNDIPSSFLVDNTDTTGFIAFQVHTVRNIPENIGLNIKFRNVRIITENPERFARKANIGIAQINVVPNTVTVWETNKGWKLLFDGRSTSGWHGVCIDKFPEKGWNIENGALTVLGIDESKDRGGDIMSNDKYSDFELRFEFRINPLSSGGVKYLVVKGGDGNDCFWTGPEYQITDDKVKGLLKNQEMVSLYDLMPAQNRFPSPVGQWNIGKICARDSLVQYWLNSLKVLEFNRRDESFRKMVKDSNFSDKKFNLTCPFGEASEGYILLMDKGTKVAYRSIKILRFKN
jgi:hypothetical protein